jgi:amino acid permease
VCGLAAFYSIYLLVLCSIITGKNSYEELAHSVFGRATEIVVDISIIIFTWGSTVAYMVIIGATTTPRVTSSPLAAQLTLLAQVTRYRH